MADQELGPSLIFHPAARRVVRFGRFRFDLSDGLLSQDGQPIHLPPRALVLLQHLVERAGRVVSKDALMDAAWKDAHVSETSLTEAMGVLRQLLGDDAQHPQFIQTVHRRGYRFIAVVSLDDTGNRASTMAMVPAATPAPAPDAAGPARGRRSPAVAAGALAVVIAGAAVVVWLGRPAGRDPMTRVSVTLPADQAPAPGLSAHPVFAVSPDGQQIAYVAGSTGNYQLYLRQLDRYAALPIPGTQGGHGPFFSPDGAWLAFFAGGALKKLRLPAGDPVTIAPAPGGFGGTWIDDRTIVFAPHANGPLQLVSAEGGPPSTIRSTPDHVGYRWPQVASDRDTIVATRWSGALRDASVVAISLATGKETTIVERGTFGRWVPTGHVVFVTDGTMHAMPFPATADVELQPLADRIMTGVTGAAQFAFSRTGALVYLPDDPDRRRRLLALVSPSGQVTDLPSPGRTYQNVAACGEALAASISERGTTELWIGHLRRAAWTRLTSGDTSIEPVWSPDCRRLAFGSGRGGIVNIYSQRVDSSDAAERLLASNHPQAPGSWSTDGRRLSFVDVDPVTRGDIWILDTATGVATPIVRTPAQESAPRLSPDNRWMAYQSDELGGPQVFLRSLDRGSRVQVSVDGGTFPAWSPDGSLLFQHQAAIWRVPPPGASGLARDPERVYAHPDLVLFRPLDAGLLIVRRISEHRPLTELKLVIGWF